jgi:hypothetical protein
MAKKDTSDISYNKRIIRSDEEISFEKPSNPPILQINIQMSDEIEIINIYKG